MFKRLASDALGLSDIGKIISPSEYDKVDSDDYIFHEDGEKIFFLIKSKQDEYCFTNRAFVHVDGNSAINTKRVLRRYEYYKYPISKVFLETAGNIDLDVEIQFCIGDTKISIDVDKKQIDQLKDLYKALYSIALSIEDSQTKLYDAMDSLNKSLQVVAGARGENYDKVSELDKINQYVHNWINGSRKNYIKKDFSDIFIRYIEK